MSQGEQQQGRVTCTAEERRLLDALQAVRVHPVDIELDRATVALEVRVGGSWPAVTGSDLVRALRAATGVQA